MSGVWIGWAAGLRLSNDSGVSAALVAWMSVQAHCMPFSLHLVCITYIMGRVSKAQRGELRAPLQPKALTMRQQRLYGKILVAEHAICGKKGEEASDATCYALVTAGGVRRMQEEARFGGETPETRGISQVCGNMARNEGGIVGRLPGSENRKTASEWTCVYGSHLLYFHIHICICPGGRSFCCLISGSQLFRNTSVEDTSFSVSGETCPVEQAGGMFQYDNGKTRIEEGVK